MRQQEPCTPQAAAAAERAGAHAELLPAALAWAGAAWPGFPHALLCLQRTMLVCMRFTEKRGKCRKGAEAAHNDVPAMREVAWTWQTCLAGT